MRFQTHPITYSLIALNLIVHIVIIFISTSNPTQLQSKLALYPTVMYLYGEWWRLLTAMFVHENVLHLAGNMMALLIFGNFAEITFDKKRYLFMYFTGGIGTNLLAYFYAIYFNLTNYMAIGASGAVLTIFGAVLAAFIHTSKHTDDLQNALAAKQMIKQMSIIVIIQSVIDISNQQNSFLHHISGFIIGLILARFLLKQLHNKKYKSII